MDNDILNLEQAMEFFGVSERTMIKLLREENVPARKIGREWRFSKVALLKWLGEGDSTKYQNHAEHYQIDNDSKDILCDFAMRSRKSRSLDTAKVSVNNCLPCCPELRKIPACPSKVV